VGAQGEGGALGGAKSLALHFGELSKGNRRAEGGVWGGMVLMWLRLAQLLGSTLTYGQHMAAVARRGWPRRGDNGALKSESKINGDD
jgi:hypothetical protein